MPTEQADQPNGVVARSGAETQLSRAKAVAAKARGLKGLPAGQMPASRWRDALLGVDEEVFQAFEDAGLFDTDETLYLSELAGRYVRQAMDTPDVAASPTRQTGAGAGAKKDVGLGIAVTASFKPGNSYGTGLAPANGGNLTRLHDRMLAVTRSSAFNDMLKSIGLKTVGSNQITIRGMWAGEPEWTQVLRFKQLDGSPASFEQARAVANLLGWGAQQDAALTSMVVENPVDGVYNIPSLYFGKSDNVAMTAKEIDTALAEFAKVAFGASVTPDGKAVKFLFFPDEKSKKSEQAQYDEFLTALSDVAKQVGLDPAPARAFTISSLDEFNKETNENEGRGYRGRLEKAWGSAAQGLGPRAVPGGIGRRAVDVVLVPYIAALRAEGFSFDFDVWKRRNGATDRQLTELREKVEAYEADKKHGLVPRLREKIDISGLPEVPIEGPVAQKTSSPKPRRKEGKDWKEKTWGNALEQLAVLDDIKRRFPDAAESAENWLRMEAHAFGGNDVPVAPRNLINLMQNRGEGLLAQLRQLTPGQISDAQAGFDNAAKFFELYTTGQVPVETTGKLLLWSFLSRGVSPYTQEAMFVDAVRGVEPFIRQAADGNFGPAELKAFEKWADGIAKANGQGAPGNATKHNLNAFGESFLAGMSQRLPNADLEFVGQTKLQYLHDLLSDSTKSGRDIRREFVKMGEGVGIDNKVVSFTLLVTGRTDVFVLDRIQMRNLFDDGSFEGYNLYDGTRITKLVTGSKEKDDRVIHDSIKQEEGEDDASFDERVSSAVDALAKTLKVPASRITAERALEPGTGLAAMTTGTRGLLLYEMMEDKLQTVLPRVYGELGREADASPGRYHWESWVVVSGQEASHGTLDSLLLEVEGHDAPFADVTVKQGEYGQKDYGVRYGRDRSGAPYYTYPDSSRQNYRLTHDQWRALLKDIDRIKARIPGFLLSKNEDGSGRTSPWYNDPRFPRAALDEAVAKRGTPEATQPVIKASITRNPQIETAEFKRWFGDSKVVDGAGRPQVVYHGTRADVSAFDPEAVGSNFGLDEVGFFFTSSPIKAASYADPESAFAQAGMRTTRGPEEGANIIPAYLSLQNPLTLETYTDYFDSTPAYEIDEQGISITDYFDDNRRNIISIAREGGHDGVLFQHKGDLLGVAFRPEQIKSATGNAGSFDPTNPDIRASATRNPLGFYSQLAKAIDSVPARLATQPAAQWKLWLSSNASKLGVKADEIQWSGINEWLDLQGKRKVEKAEVVQYLEQGGVQVEEVQKGGRPGLGVLVRRVAAGRVRASSWVRAR